MGTAGESACKPAFGSSWGGLPVGEARFYSRTPQAKGRTQHGPCPWASCPRFSWLTVVLTHEWVGGRGCVQTCPCPSQAQPGKGVSPGPRPQLRPNGRGGAERGCLHPAAAQGTGPSGRAKRGFSTSPGWMHETSAQGWYTGKTQRDQMGREAGGGIRMGNTCKSMADSCQCDKNHYNVVK